MMSLEPSPEHPPRSDPSAKALGRREASRQSSGAASADESETADYNRITIVVGGSAIVVDPNLLSPPLSINNLETSPFKPVDSDTTSLTMKNRRSRKARRRRNASDRASTGGSEEISASLRHGTRQFLTSSSVPDLRPEKRSPSWPSESSAAGQLLMGQELQRLRIAHQRESNVRSAECRRRASLPQRQRRWTMPSKAASTRVLSEPSTRMITTTSMVPSSIDQQQPTQSFTGTLRPSQPSIPRSWQVSNRGETTNAMETPAMITLRRATSKRNDSSIRRRASLRPDAIISFPPPKFNRTSSTYFSSLFGLSSPRLLRNEDHDLLLQTSVRQSSWSTGLDFAPSLQQASVTATKVQLTANTIAAPAFTQVEFLPLSRRTHATQQEEMLALSARRCSTTIVSGSSVHEIIWDENVEGSSVGGSDSAPVSRRISAKSKPPESPDHENRKDSSSALVEKLEAQLRSNERRKLSLDSQSLGVGGGSASHHARSSVSSSTPTHHHQGDGRSTLRKLTRSWHRASLAEDMNHTWPARWSLDLTHSLSHHDLTREAVGISTTLQDEPPPSPSGEEQVAAFCPPLEWSKANTQLSDPLREPLTSSAGQNKHVVIQEPVRSDWRKHITIEEPASQCAKKTVTGGVRRESTDRLYHHHHHHHHPPPTTPSSSSMGTGLGYSAYLRRASTDLVGPTHHQRQKESSRSWSRSQLSLSPGLGQGATGGGGWLAQEEVANDDGDERKPLLPRHGDTFGDGPGREDGLFGLGQQGGVLGLGYVSAPLSQTHLPLTAGGDKPRTMSVQDFVSRIERMNLNLNLDLNLDLNARGL